MMLSQTVLPQASATTADFELVLRARKGDRLAQEELARRHRRPMYFLALQLLGNPDDAMDVVQDALVRFLTTIHRFDPKRPVRPWLYRIVRNRVIDLARRRRVRKHDSIDDRDPEGNLRLVLPDPSIDLERDAGQSQLRALLFQALGELSSKQREIIVMRDYQDLSYKEIASTLDIPIGTVMSRLHGARKRLRDVLQDDLYDYTQ